MDHNMKYRSTHGKEDRVQEHTSPAHSFSRRLRKESSRRTAQTNPPGGPANPANALESRGCARSRSASTEQEQKTISVKPVLQVSSAFGRLMIRKPCLVLLYVLSA